MSGRGPTRWVSDAARETFDDVFEEVHGELPADLHELLETIPVVVEDVPGAALCRQLGVGDPRSLCGLHTGVPLTARSVFHSGTLPDTITLFRAGILATSTDRDGRVHRPSLKRQIRITLLHEIGHHFGLGERDLRRLGYG